jgi:alcohol dehydrogenase class IV
MPREFKTVALWGRFDEPSVAEPARQVLVHLRERGIEVLVPSEADGRGQLGSAPRIDENDIAAKVDLVVAVGGCMPPDTSRAVASRCSASIAAGSDF